MNFERISGCDNIFLGEKCIVYTYLMQEFG